MMQSYTGTIHIFPNTRNLGPARFENLRAAGAFLVSASFDGKRITGISVLSEKGKTVRLAKSSASSAVKVLRVRDNHEMVVNHEGGTVAFDTDPGERYHVQSI